MAQVEIKGEIKGFGSDTIYMYGNDELSDFIETIYVENDKFSVTLPIDTLTQAMLFINDQEEYPIYLEKGKTIQIKGNKNTPGVFEVKGNKPNEELTAFNKSLTGARLTNSSDTLVARMVEDYIHQNQKSLINIYLLDKYFVQQYPTDFTKIKQLIDIMDGALQDKPYIERLTEIIEQNEKSEINKIAPLFTTTNSEGKKISRSDFRDKYLLMIFWASWNDSCKKSNQDLKKIYKTYPPKKKSSNVKNNKDKKEVELAILGISLDLDRTDWKETIKNDTLKWEQANDFLGWSSTMIKQYAVYEIPYNILIDTKGKIIARGIKGEELKQKVDSLLKQN